MLLFGDTVPKPANDLSTLYMGMARDGMVQSSIMNGERYEKAAHFEDDWAVDSVTWSAGGVETYEFDGRKPIIIRPAGVLAIAAGDRYSYTASGAPFFSSMISFPRWISQDAMTGALGGARFHRLETQLFMPDEVLMGRLNEIAHACRKGWLIDDWYRERLALVYGDLLDAQRRRARRPVSAARKTTQAELARRISRAERFMLEAYADPALGLERIAIEACLSRFHLIRVFREIVGVTPVQYLTEVRLRAAHAMITDTRKTIAQIAASVGYRDRAAFFRAFKRRYGLAPSALERPYQD